MKSSSTYITIALLLSITLRGSKARPPSTSSLLDSSSTFPSDQTPQLTPKLSSYYLDKQLDPFMQVHRITPTSNSITCNDGSPIGYYKRANSHSKSWIIYLQGGGFCASHESCHQRWQMSPHLMSSNYWPKTKTVDGILSSDPKENPYLWNANHIYVPYCSSDSWTGLAPSQRSSQTNNQSSPSFVFMGSKILERVLDSLYEDFPRESSLHEAKFILLAGDSAGATGVILNLDKVNKIIERKANLQRIKSCDTNSMNCDPTQKLPILRGLADSGWFLDNEPYDFGRTEMPYDTNDSEANGEDCDKSRCTPLQSIRLAMRHWNGQVPPACSNQYASEPWKCYFGYRTYQTLKTPLFVVQWLYDEAQLLVDNIARPDTSGQWNYVHKLVNEMRTSLENVTALFAPSCFSHSLIIRRSWNQININGFKLPHVLNSWEEQMSLDTTHAIASLDGGQRPQATSIQDKQQPQTSSSMTYIPAAIQPTFEALTLEQESHSGSTNTQPLISHNIAQLPILQELRQPPVKSSATNNNRSRSTRKRKRNNQNQRSKQLRQKSAPDVHSVGSETSSIVKEINDLSSSSTQDFVPVIDRSLTSGDLVFSRLNRDVTPVSTNNGRLGRSTLVDDATLMLNNVPDDNSQPSSFEHRTDSTWSSESRSYPLTSNIGLITTNRYSSTARFRLVDSCGWPQCNRDCPVSDVDYISATQIRF